jgi:hypothetical protein
MSKNEKAKICCMEECKREALDADLCDVHYFAGTELPPSLAEIVLTWAAFRKVSVRSALRTIAVEWADFVSETQDFGVPLLAFIDRRDHGLTVPGAEKLCQELKTTPEGLIGLILHQWTVFERAKELLPKGQTLTSVIFTDMDDPALKNKLTELFVKRSAQKH